MLRSPNHIMTRELSCGVIARRSRGELLLCHATGRNYWDIPKGLADPGEDPRAAALRELREEACLTVEPAQLRDLGVHAYLPRKNLHLFVVDPPDSALDIERCSCSSLFTPRHGGRPVPEVDAYRWAIRDWVPNLCGKNMTRVLLALYW